jgi:hypothetical protein
MVTCISPNERFFEENLSSISYAAKASKIANKPRRNDDPKSQEIKMLKKQNKVLTIELRKANEYIQSLCLVRGIDNARVFGPDTAYPREMN